jgi:hypothetical protein
MNDTGADANLMRVSRGRKLLIAPLLSWYHASWDTRPDPPTETLDSLCRGQQTTTVIFVRPWSP